MTPFVKTEKKDGSTAHDPYVAFRRRIEKMQTRKVWSTNSVFQTSVIYIFIPLLLNIQRYI